MLTRRGFIGMLTAAFAAIRLPVPGVWSRRIYRHDPTKTTTFTFDVPPPPPEVTERRLYRVVPGDGEPYVLIATNKPPETDWTYLP